MTKLQLSNLVAIIEAYAIPSGKIPLGDYPATADAVNAAKQTLLKMKDWQTLEIAEPANMQPPALVRQIDESKPKESAK